MKIHPIVEWIVVPLLVGTALLWTGVWAVAQLGMFLLDKRFFGLAPAVVFAVDDFVVWALVSILAGLLVGSVAWRQPISVALLTCAVALLAFLLSAVVDDFALSVALQLFLEPLLLMVVFVTLGAWLGAKVRRGLTMRWSGP